MSFMFLSMLAKLRETPLIHVKMAKKESMLSRKAHWWKCFGSSEVIDSSESRQNYQDGEGFSDLSGYPVESRTHPRGYLSESPFRGQVHKSGTSSIRTAEH